MQLQLAFFVSYAMKQLLTIYERCGAPSTYALDSLPFSNMIRHFTAFRTEFQEHETQNASKQQYADGPSTNLCERLSSRSILGDAFGTLLCHSCQKTSGGQWPTMTKSLSALTDLERLIAVLTQTENSTEARY